VVLGRLFRRASGEEQESQEEGQKAAPTVRVLAGGRELSLEPEDTVVIVKRPVVVDRGEVKELVVFRYVPAPHKLESGSATPSTVELGEPVRQESAVSVTHKGDHLSVGGKDFRIGAGSGVLYFEGGTASISLEMEPSFSVEAAGYWAHFGVDWRSVQAPRGDPVERFTVEVYRRLGKVVEKAAEIQLEPGDRAIIGRWSGELAEKYGIEPTPESTTVPHILVVDSGGRVKHYAPLGVAADIAVSRTHLILEVPREGGGLIVQDYGYRGQGSTSKTELFLEDIEGKPMTLTLHKNSARFYPASPSKGLGVQLGESVLLDIRASA